MAPRFLRSNIPAPVGICQRRPSGLCRLGARGLFPPMAGILLPPVMWTLRAAFQTPRRGSSAHLPVGLCPGRFAVAGGFSREVT